MIYLDAHAKSVKSFLSWKVSCGFISLLVMHILFAVFAISVFASHKTFGSSPLCNGATKVFFFRTIDVGKVLSILIVVVHALYLFNIVVSMIVAVIIFFNLSEEEKQGDPDELIRVSHFLYPVLVFTLSLGSVWTELPMVRRFGV